MILLLFIGVASGFVVPPLHLDTYSDSFARDKVLPLCSAAYSASPAACLSKRFYNAEFSRQVNVQCSKTTKAICSGFTAILHDEQAIAISFPGNSEFLQIIRESTKTIFSSKSDWPAGGAVSTYFNDAFINLWRAGLNDDVSKLISNHPRYQVWVTGHSLGGAIASLCASNMLFNKMIDASQMKLFTMGQPRTGNKAWAAAHDLQFLNGSTYRITHWRDIGAHVPPEDFEGYWHHGNEVWYKEDMSVGAYHNVCYGDESNQCSDWLTFTLSMDDHEHYFEKDVSAWGEGGCA